MGTRLLTTNMHTSCRKFVIHLHGAMHGVEQPLKFIAHIWPKEELVIVNTETIP